MRNENFDFEPINKTKNFAIAICKPCQLGKKKKTNNTLLNFSTKVDANKPLILSQLE